MGAPVLFSAMHKSRAHLVIDSQKAAINRKVKGIEANLHKVRSAEKEYRTNDALAKAPDGGIPRDTLEASLGRPLHHTAIIARLRRANPGLHFEVSPVTHRIGIYDHKRTYLGMTIGQGTNPEFTPLIERPDGTLMSVQSGYRTVLSRLIRSRHLTEHQVAQFFGAVNSEKWQRSLA